MVGIFSHVGAGGQTTAFQNQLNVDDQGKEFPKTEPKANVAF